MAKKAKKKTAVKRRRSSQRSTPAPTPTPGTRIDRLEHLAAEYGAHANIEKAAKSEKKTITGELLEILRALDDAYKVEVGASRVTRVKTVHKRLDPMMLLKAGVSADVIAKCTVDGAPSYSVRVSDLKYPRDGAALIVTVREHDAAAGEGV